MNAYGENIKKLLKNKADYISQYSLDNSLDSDNILQAKDLVLDGKIQMNTPQSTIKGLNA